MAFKVLRNPSPTTRRGRPYTVEELDFFWDRLQQLAVRLDKASRDDLVNRRPNFKLGLVNKLVSRAGVFTLTGRLRLARRLTPDGGTRFSRCGGRRG